MSDLGFLEKLLNGADVEWNRVGNVAVLRRGRVMSKEYLADNAGAFPVYSSQTARNGMIGKIGSYDFDGEYVSWTTDGANAGTVFHRTGKFSITNVCGVLKSNGERPLDLKFLYYWLSISAYKYVAAGMGNPKLMSHQVEKIPVPIPCPDEPDKSLSIQGEIVRILDSFTELTAELTAELAARKKQYNHYREQLLTFDKGVVEWKALGKLTKIKAGQSVDKRIIAERPGQYPVINSGRDPLGFLADWNTEDDPIGITSRGAGVGSVTWQEGRYFRGNLNYSVTINSDDDLNVNYLYHILEQFQPEIKALCTFDGIPALNAVNLKKLSIPVPSLAEQARIVAILDKFDTITTSLSEGLPREIALRQQQYEYYRDVLLSFPKPEEAIGS